MLVHVHIVSEMMESYGYETTYYRLQIGNQGFSEGTFRGIVDVSIKNKNNTNYVGCMVYLLHVYLI